MSFVLTRFYPFRFLPCSFLYTCHESYPQAPLQDRIKNGGTGLDLPGAEGFETGTLGLQHVETAGRAGQDTHQRIHCVSNPCTIKVNEVVIGVTSTDSIFHTSKAETNANLAPGTRLRRIAQHLLQQRSYYPLFPPEEGVNLDLKRMQQWTMPCKPDILVCPSKLKYFADTVLDSTVAINPGQLTKSTTGGTYAMLEVHPMKRDTLEASSEEVELEHALPNRIRVEIKRI